MVWKRDICEARLSRNVIELRESVLYFSHAHQTYTEARVIVNAMGDLLSQGYIQIRSEPYNR